MEDKKLQKEDLSEVSGGVFTISQQDGKSVEYGVAGVTCPAFATIESFADNVIMRGEGVTEKKWPEGFKNKLINSIIFQQAFEKIKRKGISDCVVRIGVNAEGNIRLVRFY